MKRVLIAGSNSFVGTNVENYLKSLDYLVDSVDTKNEDWIEFDFTKYDCLFLVAGIAHIKEDDNNRHLYDEVNHKLAVKIALKAKSSGVKHLVFMSSMSVYGIEHTNEIITTKTATKPITAYGNSKLNAEVALKQLVDETFTVTIVRAPMIYGENCPGNMNRLERFVSKFHIFPKYINERTAITITELSVSIETYIRNRVNKTVIPSSNEDLVPLKYIEEYAKEKNIKLYTTRIFNPFIRLLIGRVGIVTKLFGNLRCEREGNGQ